MPDIDQTRTPKDCKTIEQICELRSDNIEIGNHILQIDEDEVAIVTAGYEGVVIPREDFDAMVEWYMRSQPLGEVAVE